MIKQTVMLKRGLEEDKKNLFSFFYIHDIICIRYGDIKWLIIFLRY